LHSSAATGWQVAPGVHRGDAGTTVSVEFQDHRPDHAHEIIGGVGGGPAPEQPAQKRDRAQDGNLGVLFQILVLTQATDGEAFTALQTHGGLGLTGRDHGVGVAIVLLVTGDVGIPGPGTRWRTTPGCGRNCRTGAPCCRRAAGWWRMGCRKAGLPDWKRGLDEAAFAAGVTCARPA